MPSTETIDLTRAVQRMCLPEYHWPTDAQYGLHVHYSCWPVGSQWQWCFSTSLMGLRTHLRNWREFSRYEDNFVVEINAYVWDWGPRHIDTNHRIN